MNKYIPFLKLKSNEIQALKLIDDEIKGYITPFFDLARKKDSDEESLMKQVDRASRSVEINLKDYHEFFLDDFDIDDSIQIGGEDKYKYIVNSFSKFNFIPVVGFDRTSERNSIILDAKKAGVISSDKIAIRLVQDDLDSFLLIEPELDEIIDFFRSDFDSFQLILDLRICQRKNLDRFALQLQTFISESHASGKFIDLILTGSSIPPSIGEIVEVTTEVDYERTELEIYRLIGEDIKKATLADYTIISPDYSEIDIIPEAMRNVTAPMIRYSYDDCHFIIRGGSLKNHPRGDLQYNDMAKIVVNKSFFREEDFSFGEEFLIEKSLEKGSKVTPSSILKPTINTHITYMVKEYS